MKQINKAILSGTVWSMGGQFGTMAISLITNIILARILTPYQFGQIGIIMFFIVLANVFTESGLAGALIRKKEVTKEDYSTVFVFNLVVSIVCYIILLLSSGAISQFYEDDSLQNILQVSGVILLINAFQITQNAQLMRSLKFRQKSLYRFIAVSFASVIGICFAYLGMGVWSLIIMQILTALFNTFLLWIYEGSFFSLSFNKHSFKSLYSFGINTTLASLLNTIFDNIYQLILGRYFAISQVGYFFQAKKLQEVPVGVIKSTTLGVVFSSLSKIQEDKELFAKTYNKIILLFTVTMGLLTSVIFVHSKGMVLLLYGATWSEASFYMQLLTIASFFYMQEMFNRVLFKVFNQTHKILYLEFIKKAIQAVSIVIGVVKLDLTILLYGFVGTSIISYMINSYFSRKIMRTTSRYEAYVVLKVIGISIFISGVMVFISEYIKVDGISSLYLLPLHAFLYLWCIHLIGIINLVRESKSAIQLIKSLSI